MVHLYSFASYNVYSMACSGGLVMLLYVVCVEADHEVNVKCVCMTCLYAAGNGFQIPAQLQLLLIGLCIGVMQGSMLRLNLCMPKVSFRELCY